MSFRAMQAHGRQRRAHQRPVRRRAIRPIRGDFARRPSTPAVVRVRSGTRWGEWHGTQLGALARRRVGRAATRFRKCIFIFILFHRALEAWCGAVALQHSMGTGHR